MTYDAERTRVEFLAAVAKAQPGCRYLEIGVQNARQCFDHIPAADKHGVDPAGGGATHVMTSDQFFAALSPAARYDLIFIDGDHHHEQVARDVRNALRHLAPAGVLVMHDCMPPTRDYENPSLCGTAWRAFVHLRMDPGIEAFCGEFDVGVGCARRGINSQPIPPASLRCGVWDLSYDDYQAHKQEWFRPKAFWELVRFAVTQP